jgi:hypothetical protein
VVYGVVSLLLLAGPIGHAGDGDVRHPWVLFVTASLEQHALPVNLDGAPHPATGVGEVK